jgi:hypothetical protein
MEDIERLGETSEDVPALLRMQRACRAFLTVAESKRHSEHSLPLDDEHRNAFIEALLSLRQVFKTEMDALRDKYGIEPGPLPEDINPFIGRPIRTVYIAPPKEFRQSNDEQQFTEEQAEQKDQTTEQ